MDKSVRLLEALPPDCLNLKVIHHPFFQSQHRDYWSIDEIVYDDYDLFICLDGQAVFHQGGEKIILTKGEAFLAEPGLPLSASHEGESPFVAFAQHFTIDVFGKIDLFKLIFVDKKVSFSDWTFIELIINRYKKIYENPFKRLERHSLFLMILSHFLDHSYMGEKEEGRSESHFIFQMLSFIEKNLTEWDVFERSISFSPYSRDHTSRLFRKQIGIAPKSYIINKRLNLACQYLRQNLAVKETAFLCGFSDELYFSRVFKKYFLISPREFKRQQDIY